MADLVSGDPAAFWSGRRVFLTGHTGFKGSWLSLWLAKLGARVSGFALSPATTPSMFEEARVADHLIAHVLGDVRDLDAVGAAMAAARPEIVLHLAAQPLVRASYDDPVATYAVNVMGTVNVLEACRRVGDVKAALVVTTDKCYENREWEWGYRETDALGGRDPYANSKACAELVTSAYRASFLADAGTHVASGRAGNVIGGGDWAADRLIPDVLRSLDAGLPLTIRSPGAVRPWQHVLEPLSGYLLLAQQLTETGERVATGWNFGPGEDDAKSVEWILGRLQQLQPALAWNLTGERQSHEAGLLKLDSARARAELGWRPRWSLSRALDATLAWHEAWRSGGDAAAISLDQIARYEADGPHE